jgi:hypothetical protein
MTLQILQDDTLDLCNLYAGRTFVRSSNKGRLLRVENTNKKNSRHSTKIKQEKASFL